MNRVIYIIGKLLLTGYIGLIFFNSCKKNEKVSFEPYPDDLPLVKDTISPDLLGCFAAGVEEKAAVIPALYDDIPKLADTVSRTVRIVLDPTIVLAKVSKYVYGNNVNQYNGNFNSFSMLVDRLNLLNPHILRYPGGLHSNEFFWNANGKDGLPNDLPSKLINSSKQTYNPYWVVGANGDSYNFGINDFYEFLKKTNCEAVMTVNYSYARYGTGPTPVQTAAHMAADWVRYDYIKTQALGMAPTKFWEIGNESCTNWSSGYYIDTSLNQDGQPEVITPKLYGEHVKIFADSMRKAASEFGHTIYIGSQNDIGVFSGAGDTPDWMVDHTYFTAYQQNSNAQTVLNSVKTEAAGYPLKTKLETAKYGVPFKPSTLTEWNIFAEGSGQNVSYINGMHGVMVLGELIKNQYGMSNRWGILNAWIAKNGEDMGLLRTGGDWIPYAPFFYLYYFQQFFGDKMVNYAMDGASKDLVLYASSFTSGELGVVLVNKATTEQVAQLYFMNFTPGKRFYYYILTGGNERSAETGYSPQFSRQVFVNGNGPTTTIGGPISKLTEIKPYSSTITNTFKIKVPARSVQYILIEKNK
jgi:hypothetical protein